MNAPTIRLRTPHGLGRLATALVLALLWPCPGFSEHAHHAPKHRPGPAAGRGPASAEKASPTPRIDLVTPDGGYGGRLNVPARGAKGGLAHTGVVPAPRRYLPYRSPDFRVVSPGPVRNAIGASVPTASSVAKPVPGMAAVGVTSVQRPQPVTGLGAPSAGVTSRGLGSPGLNVGHAAPAVAAPARPVAGINGTGMARPGSGPSTIGGGVRATTGINGSAARPRH